MLTVLTANGPSGYAVKNSLRFRSSASAYLNRTPSVAGNRTTWTWSAWVKRGSRLGSTYDPVFAAGSSGSAYSALWFNNDTFVVYSYSGATSYYLVTTQVFRDPSAWYHIQVAVDTTQATSTNRIKLYVNGVQVTSFSTATYPSQNYLDYFDSTASHYFGQYTPALGSIYFDGYLSEINFIDGQALTPSSFGQINTTTGVWQPIRYSGTYGTNGFKLNFSNGTSTTTLGYDSSGNSNNWTTNNISLTAGSTYDWMIDSPTPFAGSSYGVGNYAVLNPLNKYPTSTTAAANLQWSPGTNSVWNGISGSIAVSSGKWYWEYTLDQSGVLDRMIGIFSLKDDLSVGTFPGNSASSYGFYSVNGQKYNNATGTAYGSTYQTAGDVIGIALDLDTGTLTFYKNGTSQGVAFSGIAGTFTPGFAHTNTTIVAIVNFGQRPFSYTPPTGFKTLCTFNLPTPSIVNGAAYMAATLYTGTGATQSISNAVNSVSFQPDFVWTKSRSATAWHSLVDSVRGVYKNLFSNATNAETTYTNYTVTAFNSNGATVADDSAGGYGVNGSGITYVSWQWKAGGTAVTNTAGSITSQVSANTTAGFSVVTWTTPSSGSFTVGHGLGVAPSMVITKARSSVLGWATYHISTGNTGFMNLCTTAAFAIDSNFLGNTSPSSSIISCGAASFFGPGYTYVAYCFAAIPGYSAFGSYTGNGSTDGPFVYTGFRPRFVLIKQSNALSEWFSRDSARAGYNAASNILFPSSSSAEITGAAVYFDILSNGFKLRQDNTTGYANANGGTYIYAAFAENPFQNSLAR